MAASSSPCSTDREGRGRYDHTRFDNPSGWVDQQARSRARQEGRSLGFGYADPREPAPPRKEKPFYSQEYAFTSGILVNRKYDQFPSSFAAETMRTDPWHFPNVLKTQDSDHFKDQRRRTQNIDTWQSDPSLNVPDELFRQHVSVQRGENLAGIDPKKMEPLFAEGIRPSPETLRELNVDLSCAQLPAREAGPRGLGASSSRASAAPSARSSPGAGGPGPTGSEEKWRWCLGGRKSTTAATSLELPKEHLPKSRSLPQMSTLSGNLGSASATFHGVPTRKFGQGSWDARMRGGKNARDGFAGTFPAKESRLM